MTVDEIHDYRALYNPLSLVCDAAIRAQSLGASPAQLATTLDIIAFPTIERRFCAWLGNAAAAVIELGGDPTAGMDVWGIAEAFRAPFAYSRSAFERLGLSAPAFAPVLAAMTLMDHDPGNEGWLDVWTDVLKRIEAAPTVGAWDGERHHLALLSEGFVDAIRRLPEYDTIVGRAVDTLEGAGSSRIRMALGADSDTAFLDELHAAGTYLSAADFICSRPFSLEWGTPNIQLPLSGLNRMAVVVEEKLVRTWTYPKALLCTLLGHRSSPNEHVLDMMRRVAHSEGTDAAERVGKEAVLNHLLGTSHHLEMWMDDIRGEHEGGHSQS